jgi:hypothetical protein
MSRMHLTRWLRAEWDRVAGYASIAVGLVVLLTGINGVRHAEDVVDQLAYLTSGGIGAMFLLGVGATLLLSADLHDDWRKLNRVEQKLDRVEALLQEARDPAPQAAPGGETAAPSAQATAQASTSLRRARTLAFGALLIGLALVVLGRLHIGSDPDHLTAGISTAIAGPFLAALCAVSLTVRQKGMLERRKMAVFGSWSDAEPGFTRTPERGSGNAGTPVWVAEGLRRYHRAGCPALSGRPAREVERAAMPAGLVACGVCEPD